MPRQRVTFVTLVALLLCASLSHAQTGTIQGTLLDSAGATIPGAKVIAIDQDKQLIVRETETAKDGTFYLRPLLPGTYTVKADAAGFKGLERTDLKLDQNQVMNLGQLALQIGSTSESITVSAEVPLVDTSTAQKSFVISSRQVTELSLNGRDFQSLMRTLPGVTSNSSSDFRLAFNNTDQFNVNGLRGSMNNVFLDGAINTDVGANDGQYTQVSLDAVGEFRVQTSTFNAEYGRNPGVLIAINTKSGTSTFHGSAYEFVRNDAFDARRPFDTTGKPPKIRFNQFGGNLGGPIPIAPFSSGDTKKLFFFVNLEKTLGSRPLGGTWIDIVHPDLLNGDLSRLYRPGYILDASNQPTQFRNGQIFRPGTVKRSGARIIGGDPYPNNVIPKSEWSKNASAFTKVLSFLDPSGAAAHPTSPELLRYPYQEQYTMNKFGKVARIDYNINTYHNLFFRWTDDGQHEEETLGIFSNSAYPNQPQYREKPGASWTWSIINVFTPRLTNEGIFTYNHLTQVLDIVEGTPKSWYDKTELGFTYQDLYPESNYRNRYPRFNCNLGNCNMTGFASGWKSEGKTFAWSDTLTWNTGRHTFKTGFFWNRNDNGQQPAWTDTVNFNFGSSTDNPMDTGNSFANMLTGWYTTMNQTNGIFYGDYRFYGYEAFGQDSWKITDRFTLEYGMRWAYYGPTYTVGKYLAPYMDLRKYDPSKAVQLANNGSIVSGSGDPFNGIVREGDAGVPQGFSKHRWNNWAPRLGFAWDPFGDGKTSIRGGGGLFYERVRQNVNNFAVLGNPPVTYNPTIPAGNVDNVSPALVQAGTRFPMDVVAWDAEGQVPTIYAYSFGIQRELGHGTSLDLGYVGNQGRYLQYRRNLNQLPLGTTTTPGVLASVGNLQNRLRPYQGYVNFNYTEYGAISNYNALQARISRRFAKSLTANFNYTWSKAMNENDADGDTISYHLDRHMDYGPAGYDRTHTVTIDYVYELPRFGDKFGNGFAKGLLNGWQVSGISRFWSGRPFNPTSNHNTGTTNGSNQRPNYIGGPIVPENQDRYNYFNVFAFARPLEGTFGNVGRNALRGPGINNWDISLFKNTRIRENVNLQFRLETFNTFNHTQWDQVNVSMNAPNPGAALTEATRGNAGTVTETRDPRSIQMGLKLIF